MQLSHLLSSRGFAVEECTTRQAGTPAQQWLQSLQHTFLLCSREGVHCAITCCYISLQAYVCGSALHDCCVCRSAARCRSNVTVSDVLAACRTVTCLRSVHLVFHSVVICWAMKCTIQYLLLQVKPSSLTPPSRISLKWCEPIETYQCCQYQAQMSPSSISYSWLGQSVLTVYCLLPTRSLSCLFHGFPGSALDTVASHSQNLAG